MKAPASLTLPAQMNSLAPLLAFVKAFASKSGFGKERIREIELCLEEILVNIIRYAYPEKPGEVAIFCSKANNGALYLEVVDQGVPFDILTAKAPDIGAGIDERGIGGLGIFFVRQFMDHVRYRRENNNNIITLSIDPAPPPGINPPPARPSPP